MNAERLGLDTSIPVCALARDAGERHEIAAELVDQAVEWDRVLPLQVLCEFFAVARMNKESGAAWTPLRSRAGPAGQQSKYRANSHGVGRMRMGSTSFSRL